MGSRSYAAVRSVTYVIDGSVTCVVDGDISTPGVLRAKVVMSLLRGLPSEGDIDTFVVSRPDDVVLRPKDGKEGFLSLSRLDSLEPGGMVCSEPLDGAIDGLGDGVIGLSSPLFGVLDPEAFLDVGKSEGDGIGGGIFPIFFV